MRSERSATALTRMPDAFIILFFVVLAAAIVTHIIPAGKFEVVVDQATGKSQLLADSFQLVNNYQGVPLFAENGNIGFLNFAFEGMVSGSKWGSAIGVMMFIIITGGAFGVVMQTKAITNGVMALVNKTQRLEQAFLPILFVLFSLGGAIFGMGEEAIAFCIVLLPLVRALGYDAITTVLVTYVATQIGFATSWMNPFSVAIAQGIAQVPLMSGIEFRLLLWLIFTVIGLLFTLRYAKSVKQTKQAQTVNNDAINTKATHFNWVDSAILTSFLAVILWMIWGVTQKQYYIPEIASQFFTLAVITAIIAVIGKRLTLNQVADAFKQGAQDLLPAAMIVGMAKGIVLILGGDSPAQASSLNTILHYSATFIGQLPQDFSAVLMYLFQSIFNFFIASGSGQAALTMPIMAPLSDLVGVSRQVAVLAFQLGDGLTNLIIPTSASLIGCLGVAGIDYMTWAKFIARFMLLLMLFATAFILLAVHLQLS